MKWLTNNFSLNMVTTKENYTLKVEYMDLAEFKKECQSAKNRLSQIDICQELDSYPHKGNVDADIGDSILVAQYFEGVLTYRKLTVIGDTQ